MLDRACSGGMKAVVCRRVLLEAGMRGFLAIQSLFDLDLKRMNMGLAQYRNH